MKLVLSLLAKRGDSIGEKNLEMIRILWECWKFISERSQEAMTEDILIGLEATECSELWSHTDLNWILALPLLSSGTYSIFVNMFVL